MKNINKIAEITLLFWLMKIIATTLGETLGDFLSMTLGLGYLTGIGITALFFLAALFFQVRSKRFVPMFFWLVIISTTTLGTEISDFIDRDLHLGYAWGSLLLLTGLVGVLFVWFSKFKSLSVEPIFEKNKELYFWFSVLFSNSLGTAFGDYLSDNMGLSYLSGTLVTACVIVVILGFHHLTKVNKIILFWLAFIFTRPFGATFGDLLTKPLAKGGLDLGTLRASLVSICLMLILIYISRRNLRSNLAEQATD